MITTTIAASAITPCGAPVADGRRRRTSRGTFGAGPASAKPSWNTTQVRRMGPPTREMTRSGPPAWAIAMLASGTPPNGNENLMISTSV